MSKGIKIFTLVFCIIGGVLLLAGAGMFVAGMALENWNFDALNTVRYESRTWEEGETIGSIEIRYNYADICVEVDESADKIALSYPVRVDKDGNDLGYVTLEDEGGVLRVTENRQNSGWDWDWDWSFGVQVSSPRLVLTLPAREFESITLDADAGKIEVSGVQCARLTLTADMGDIEVRGIECAFFTADADMGAISLQNATCGSAELSADMGAIVAESIVCGTFSARADTGSAQLRRMTCEQFTATTSMGNIELDGIDAQKLTLTADMGNITGTLAGAETDYTISVTVHMGSCNLADRVGGTRTLTATAEMGNITIYFA